jgi:uncharacterized protein
MERNNNAGRNAFAQTTMWLAIVGAINWGLVGFFDFDLVRAILGGETSTPASGLSRIVYALVGLAGLGLAFVAPRLRDRDTTRLPGRQPAEMRA